MVKFKRWRSCLFALTGLLLAGGTHAHAEQVPSVDELRERLGEPVTVTVFEPHLADGDNNITIEYVGYPAVAVMAALFGETWRERGETVELRALDGYISRIDTDRFKAANAFIVFARKDGAAFTVDNRAQNQANVPLGPYYLVWDNIGDRELLAEGARYWPYQISEVNLVNLSDQALLPPGLDPRYHKGAALARTHCLSCHQINGFGGEKFEGNLADIAKGFDRSDFIAWVLTPSSINPQTTMPPLSPRLPGPERQRIAQALFDYLTHVPSLP